MKVSPHGPKIFVKKYQRPEKVKGIWIPESWRQDNSRSLWEVYESSPKADEVLGVSLEPSWILITAPNSGVFGFFDDSDRLEVFVLAASSVRRIIPWTSETSDVRLRPKGLLVRLDTSEEQTSSGIFVIRSDEPQGARTGEVVEVGEEVRDVLPGASVVFSIHAGVEAEIGGEKMMMLAEGNLLATLEETSS